MAIDDDERNLVIAALAILAFMALLGVCLIVCDPVIFALDEDEEEDEVEYYERHFRNYVATNNQQTQRSQTTQQPANLNSQQIQQQQQQRQQQQQQQPRQQQTAAVAMPEAVTRNAVTKFEDSSSSSSSEGIQRTSVIKTVAAKDSSMQTPPAKNEAPALLSGSPNNKIAPNNVSESEEESEESSESISLDQINIKANSGPMDQVSPLSKNSMPAGPTRTGRSISAPRPAPPAAKRSGSLRDKLMRASSSISIPHYSHKRERQRFIICNALVLIIIICVVTVLIVGFYDV